MRYLVKSVVLRRYWRVLPLLLGTLGEILTEKAGNLNLGVEGMMFMGAVSRTGRRLFL